MKTHASIRYLVTLSVVSTFVCLFALTAPQPAGAAEDWKATFDLVCGSVQAAESMSEKEIASMIEKAEKLVPVIQASNDPAKKVYLVRLKKCRGVYEFMLETKKGSGR